MQFRFSKHCDEEIAERKIPREAVDAVLRNPEQLVHEQGNIVCYQSVVIMDGKKYLLRVRVNEEADPRVVVTVYRTSKIEKYWRHNEN